MSNPADDAMILEFSIEATDMLDQAESDLLSLDKGGEFRALYDSVFRVFHSLKGGAGMLGLEALQKHMHAVENTLSALKEKLRLSSDEINYFLEAVDAGRKILAGQSVQFNYEVTAAPKPPEKSKKQASAVKGLAYVVDDEPGILESLCDILGEAGIETRAFSNPEIALKEIQATPPDIILTDMKMPEMTGLELLQKVRQQNPDIPVILISGFITTENLLEAIRSGIFAAIEKPFKVDVVLTYALAAIKQHRTFRMFRRGLNLLLYQFSDLEDFLKANGKVDAAKTARSELTMLLAQWKDLSLNQSKEQK